DSLGWSLRVIARRTYHAGSAFLLAASQAADAATSDPERLFIANAVAPILSYGSSQYYRENVLPHFTELLSFFNRRYSATGLREIPGDHRLLGLQLFVKGLSQLREDLGVEWAQTASVLAEAGK